MTALGVLSATAPLMSCGDQGDIVALAEQEAAASRPLTVYRFQTRKGNTCKACRNHQHYKVFADPLIASANRAHPGCNCAIVPQTVTEDYLATLAAYEINGAVDLRAIYV